MIKPVKNQMLLDLEQNKENKTKSGIIVATDENVIYETATVLEIGEDVNKTMKGCRIAYKSYNLDNVEIDDKMYSFLEDKHVIAIVV